MRTGGRRDLSGSVLILETPRLRVERFTLEDAGFILRLLNDPDFIRNIADKGVRTLEAAGAYLAGGPLAHYDRHGFGLWRVSERGTGAPVGMCGLIRRDTLADVDLGYALLPEFTGKGYATEAARAVVDHARLRLSLRRLVAIVSPGNDRSIRLLERLGFAFERMMLWPPDDEEISIYALEMEG
jgi:RimJ/RimL family protein N-acetyltransferase